MDTSALLGGILNAGSGIAGKAMSGNTKGLGGDVGSAAGGLLGTAFGGPLGSALGSTVGGLLGGGAEQLIGGAMGGGKKKKKKAAAARPPAGAGAPSKAQLRQAAAVAASAGAAPSPAAAVAPMGQAARVLAQSVKARNAASDAFGRALIPAGAPPQAKVAAYGALARLAGVDPRAALSGQVSPGALVRAAGLERVAGAMRFPGGATGLGKAMGLPLPLLRATGLLHGRPERAKLSAPTRRACVVHVVRVLHERRPTRRGGVELQMAGLSDVFPGGGGGQSLPSASGNLRDVTVARGGTPGPVPVRAANWDLDRSTYVLEYGDTLSGLAATYLGNAARWSEIWAEQPGTFRLNRSPNKLNAGESLKMPPAAVENARTLLKNPGSKVGPNGKPQGPTGATLSEWPTWAKVGLGVGGLAALGGLGYVALKVL